MGTLASPQSIGRYGIYGKIASGGMASVHFGRLLGAVGFSRTVAIKRLHPHLAEDPEFLATMIDEARMAARIHHPNVVPTLDVVSADGELLVVMEYVRGESLSRLLRAEVGSGRRVPLPIASAIVIGALHGLHAAHEATSDRGTPLGIVHRDVSPQNLLVGIDGLARVIDFGVAKAAGRLQTTRDGVLKGKMAYMAPEQLAGREAPRAADVYGMGVVLWETLAGTRRARHEGAVGRARRALRLGEGDGRDSASGRAAGVPDRRGGLGRGRGPRRAHPARSCSRGDRKQLEPGRRAAVHRGSKVDEPSRARRRWATRGDGGQRGDREVAAIEPGRGDAQASGRPRMARGAGGRAGRRRASGLLGAVPPGDGRRTEGG